MALQRRKMTPKAAPAKATKKAAPKKEAPAPRGTKLTGAEFADGLDPAPKLRLKKYDPAAMKAQFDAAKSTSRGSSPYMKFKVGKNRVRIVQLIDELFVKVREHGYQIAGQLRRALDFDTIFRNDATRTRLLESGKLKAEDYEMWAQYGDPFNVFANAYKNAFPGKQLPKSRWPETKYLWHAINREDDSLVVLEAGKKFFDFVDAAMNDAYDENGKMTSEAEYPELTDPDKGYDIMVDAVGQRLTRRYTYMIAKAPSGVALGDDVVVPDLLAIHDSRAVPYTEVVRALFANEGPNCALLGITPDNFGCGHLNIQVSAAPEQSDDTTDA